MRKDETVFSIKLNLSDSRVSEIAAIAGFECVWTDMEHVANDWSMIEKQILAAKAYDADTVVRVARGSYSDCVKPLEMDAAGIMVPHVMSLADAKSIIRHTKFYPLGLRPADRGNADGGYCTIPFTDYIRQANEQRFVILQIEDPEPLDELDDIAALPGVDMLFFGPGDFSQAIGAPGKLDHPLVAEARKRVADAAAKAGIFAGTIGTPDNCKELIDMGYRFINIGADVLGMYEYFSQIRNRAEQSVPRK